MEKQLEVKTIDQDQKEEESTDEIRTRGKKRLNLDLTADAYELLQKLSQESGKNMAEVLRTGLALYGIAQEESHKGNNLSITNDDRIVARILHV